MSVVVSLYLTPTYMLKYMLVDFKKVMNISKPSDKKLYKGFKIFSGGAGVHRSYLF
jgi:hypothetical protein